MAEASVQLQISTLPNSPGVYQYYDKNEKLLLLDISILVAVSEIDESGRRVILYQRPNQSYALYADKQIDLSI